MNCEVRDHFLFVDGEQVEYRESPNHGDEMVPRLIVIHYTASSPDDAAEGDIEWLCKPQGKKSVSAHLVVRKEGSVVQLVPFNLVAWHAGESAYDGERYVNRFSIGIENDGRGDYWPEVQAEANRAIIEALFAAYPIEDVVGHEDVAPGRKPDPGPRYPWDKVTV